MALSNIQYQPITWVSYEGALSFSAVAQTDQPNITYRIELVDDPTKYKTATVASGITATLTLTEAETTEWIQQDQVGDDGTTQFVNDQVMLTITDGVDTYVTTGTAPDEHLTFAYLPFYSPRPVTILGSTEVIVNEIEILNLTWERLYDNGDKYNLWRYVGSTWTKMTYGGSAIEFSNLKNIHFKYTDCFSALSSASTQNLFRITKDGVDYDDTNGYHLDFHYVTFIPRNNAGNITVDSTYSGYPDEGSPSGRYYIGDRVGGEKAIYLDEFITLGQLEFDGNIRARVRDIAGRLPNASGIVSADDELDLARAFNVRIESNPSTANAQFKKQINFETCSAVTPYTYDSWTWGEWRYYDLSVSEIAGSDEYLLEVWGANPFVEGKYDCTFKSITTLTNHNQPSTSYTLYFEPINSGATLRFFSLVKKSDADLPGSSTLSDNVFNVVVTKVV